MPVMSDSVRQITPEGNADKAGLQVGDVILEVSGIFGGMTNVLGEGINQV
jgi:S1-C subfamily serine protease